MTAEQRLKLKRSNSLRYYYQNREKCLAYQKKYREKNLERLKKYAKNYREKLREENKKYPRKKRYPNNKTHIKAEKLEQRHREISKRHAVFVEFCKDIRYHMYLRSIGKFKNYATHRKD